MKICVHESPIDNQGMRKALTQENWTRHAYNQEDTM